MKNKKLLHILEIIWFTLGALSLMAAIHQSIKFGVKNSSFMFILSLIAFGMFLYRRNLRRKN